MEAKELRLGNLFIEENSKQIIEVIGLEKNRVVFSGMFLDKWQAKPIDLNEEWLLKFNFQKIGKNFRKYHDYDQGSREFILFYNHSSKHYEVKANNNFYEVKYVHQLQNLYCALALFELHLLEADA
jgi:hypothetical protein